MKETGILRRIDELGRIVIPKEIRKKLKIREGDNIDIFVSDDTVILKKYSLLKDLDNILAILLEGYRQYGNISLVVTNLDHVISSNVSDVSVNDIITGELLEKILNKETIIINKNFPFKITDKNETGSYLIIKPIIVYGDVFGSVILISDFEVTNHKNTMLDLIHYFCVRYIQE